MSLSDLFDAVESTDRGLQVEIGPDWTQGRTSYGGVTAALCLMAARRLVDERRPLRSAMISFVGPSAGQVSVEAEVLREGRTASSVHTRLSGPSGIGADATFTFAAARESNLNLAPSAAPASAMPFPGADATPMVFPGGVPSFTRQLEFVWKSDGAPFTGGGQTRELSWVRLRDLKSRAHKLSLIALADALPPAVTPALNGAAPLSSMTWMIDVLVDTPRTEEGWWLLEASADHARDGYSTQDMTIWNAHGECVIKARQMVAIFA